MLVNGTKRRALLDSGARGFYISSTLIHLLRKISVTKETKQIEMMINSQTQNIKIYEAAIKDLSINFTMDVKLLKN